MSTFGLLAFIIMPILGGLIAWAGDVIGYRLGKSRRSLFGLRPRSTARVVGITVGVLLPLLSLGLAMLASNDAKEALLHLDVLRRQQQQLQQQNTTLQQQTERLRAGIVQATTEAERSARHSARLRASLRETDRELAQADRHLQATARRLARAQQNVADLKAARDTLQRLKRLLEQRKGMLEQRVVELRGRVDGSTRKLAETEKSLHEVDTKLQETRAELYNAQDEWRRQRAVAASPIIYESGHELIRILMDVGETQEITEDRLRKLLLTASGIALSSGAKPLPNGLAVRLVRGLPLTAVFTSDAEALASTAAEMRKAATREWVVQVRAVRRLYEAEKAPAQIEFYLLPYAVAFRKDEVVTSIVVDGRETTAEIFNQLWNMVTTLVRREAQERGMLRDPKSGQYGSLPAEELLKALEAVAAAKEPVTVTVRTEKETHIADPLAIRLEVSRAPAGDAHDHGTGD